MNGEDLCILHAHMALAMHLPHIVSGVRGEQPICWRPPLFWIPQHFLHRQSLFEKNPKLELLFAVKEMSV